MKKLSQLLTAILLMVATGVSLPVLAQTSSVAGAGAAANVVVGGTNTNVWSGDTNLRTGDTTVRTGDAISGSGASIDGVTLQQGITFEASKPARLQGVLPGIPGAYGPAALFLGTTGSVNPNAVPFVLFHDRWFAAKPELIRHRVGSSPYTAFDVPGASQRTKLYFVGSPSYFNPADGSAAKFIDPQTDPTQSVIPLGYLVVSPTPGNEDGVSLPVIDHDALQFAGTLRGYPHLVLIKSAQAMGAGLGQIASGSSLGAGLGGSHTSLTGLLGLSIGGSKGDSVTFMVSRLAVVYLVVAYDERGMLLPPAAFEMWVAQEQQKQAAVSAPVSAAAVANFRVGASKK